MYRDIWWDSIYTEIYIGLTYVPKYIRRDTLERHWYWLGKIGIIINPWRASDSLPVRENLSKTCNVLKIQGFIKIIVVLI